MADLGPATVLLDKAMTTVQRHQSRQQALSLRHERIDDGTNSWSSFQSQRNRKQNENSHMAAAGILLEPDPSNQNREGISRALFPSIGEATCDPLLEGCQSLVMKAIAGDAGKSQHRRQAHRSPRSAFSAERSASPTPATVTVTGERYSKEQTTPQGSNLQHLAADALPAVAPARNLHSSPLPSPIHVISISTHDLSLGDDQLPSLYLFPRKVPSIKTETQFPRSMPTPACEELPPLQMGSPNSEGSERNLPSIRSTLGDINRFPTTISSIESNGPSSPNMRTRRPGSPMPAPHLPSMSSIGHASPPVSPSGIYHRNIASAPSIPLPRISHEFPPSILTRDGYYEPSCGDYESDTAQSLSAQAPSYLAIDEGVVSSQVGSYACTFDGCNAHPFQTQYLLSSHANVHSSARPHYCPVKGCPRSEGGKGFKRKNEMIRHGLVHDSPGYVCPFCCDREHKYPRPDNLQRHVRVHHLDRGKDDPLLREILSQRPDGPRRGRRRRGGRPAT